MIYGRVLSQVLRSACSRSWNILNSWPKWNNSNIRAQSSFNFTSPHQNYTSGKVNLLTITRRFFQQDKKKGNNFSENSSPLSYKILAALGGIAGVVGGTAYHARSNDDNPFKKWNYLVYCQEASDDAAKDPCVCPEPKPCCKEKLCHSSECLHKLDCEEKLIIMANTNLRRALMDTRGKVVEYTEAALEAACEATCIMQQYLDCAYAVLDNDKLSLEKDPELYEKTWCCLFEISKARCEKVKDALQKIMCSWELLCKFREVIEEAKLCKYTDCNPLIEVSEKAFECAEQGLLQVKAKMDEVQSQNDMVEQYKEIIATFRKDVKKEIDNLPEEEKCEITHFEQEIAILINQAYIRVIRLQKELAQLQVCSGKIPRNLRGTDC